MEKNYFDQFDDDEDGGLVIVQPEPEGNPFDAFDADPDAAPPMEAPPANAARQSNEAPAPGLKPLENIPGVSFGGDPILSDRLDQLDAVRRKESTDALNKVRGENFLAGVKASIAENRRTMAQTSLDVLERIDAGEELAPEDDPLGLRTMTPEQQKAMRASFRQNIAEPARDPFAEVVLDPQQYAELAKGVPPGAVRFGGSMLQGVAAAQSAPFYMKAVGLRNRLATFEAIDRGERVANLADTRALYYQKSSPEERARQRAELELEINQYTYTPPQERAAYEAGEEVIDYAATILPPAAGYEEAVGRQLGEGVGSLIAGLPFGVIGRIPALAAFASAGSGEALQRAVQYDAAERAAGRPGLTQDQITAAGILGVVPGSTDLLPVETLLGRLKIPMPLRIPLARAIGRIGGQAFVEGIQEGGQGFLQNLIAQNYNPEQRLMEGIAPEAGLGAGVGGLTQTAKEVGQLILQRMAGRRARKAPFPGDRADLQPSREAPPVEPVEQAPTETARFTPRVARPTESVGVDVVQFIRGKGGLKPSGELTAVNAERYPGLVRESGLEADKMREALVEAGYLEEAGPDQPAITTPQDVYDLVAQQIGGERVFPVAERAGAESLTEQRQSYEFERELVGSEENFVLPELARIDEEVGADVVSSAYARLSNDEKAEVIERYARGGEAIDDVIEEIAVRNEDEPAIAAMTVGRAVRTGEAQAIRAAVEEQVPELVAEFDEMVAALPEAAGLRAPTVSEPAPSAPAISDTMRTAFAGLLDSRTPVSQWADRLGLTEDELSPLIDEAVGKGWLRRDAAGNIRRAAKTARTGAIAPMTIPDVLPETLPGEGDVALTPEAEDKWPGVRAAVDKAAARILPDAVRVEVKEAIQIARLKQEDQLHALAGVKAITADLQALARAEEMEAEGAERTQIWQETGWYRGVDGFWRFEVDDSGAVVMLPDKLSGEWSQYRSAFKHPGIYAAYPDMQRNRITFDHRTDDSQIDLSVNPNAFDQRLFDTTIGVQSLRRTMTGQIGFRPGREIEALRRVLHETQHGIQTREGFARGANIYSAVFEKIRSQVRELDSAQASLNQISEHRSGKGAVAAAEKRTKAAQDAFNEAFDKAIAETTKEEAIDVYRRTAGEVEARNVAARANMTAEERLEIPPWETQDLPDDQQIILNQGLQKAFNLRFKAGQTEDELSAILESQVEESTAREQPAEDRNAAGREGLEAGEAEPAPGAPAGAGERLPAGLGTAEPGLARAADERIIRQESASLRSDGSIIVGRQSREVEAAAEGEGAERPQSLGAIEDFDIEGYDGRVTADFLEEGDFKDGNLARLSYRIYQPGQQQGDPAEIDRLEKQRERLQAKLERARSGSATQAKLIDRLVTIDERLDDIAPIVKMHLVQRSDGAWEVGYVSSRQPQQGIGTRLYGAVEADLGIRMSPSGVLTDAGLAFWRKRSPASVKWHVATPTWGGFNFSPRKILDELERVTTEVRRLEAGVGSARHIPFDQREQDIVRLQKERGQLRRLYGDLPQEARARRVLDQMFALRAFHGSPHEFDRFDISRIGTGEGAQAFGHGLYFAENEMTAQAYQKQLAGPERFQVDGKDLPESANPFALRDYAQMKMDGDLKGLQAARKELETSLENIRKSLAENEYESDVFREVDEMDLQNIQHQLSALKQIETGTITKSLPGNLYEVSIDVEPEQLLDWDKPLSEQSKSVREALRPEIVLAQLFEVYETQFGAFAVRGLPEPDRVLLSRSDAESYAEEQTAKLFEKYTVRDVVKLTSDPSALSSVLREAGIPGIRYLDQGSRDTGEGSRNIVIFDDSLVKITKKNGKPVTGEERQGVVDQMMEGGKPSEPNDVKFALSGRRTPSSAFRRWFGDSKVVDEDGEPLVLYHGTPHEFDRFDMSKIGTGEGAQAFGHGLYFAENEATAKAYQIPRAIIFPTKEEALRATNNKGHAIATDGGWVAELPNFGGILKKDTGNLYEVEIDVKPEQLLDWDKPLSEQSKSVREALRPEIVLAQLFEVYETQFGAFAVRGLPEPDRVLLSRSDAESYAEEQTAKLFEKYTVRDVVKLTSDPSALSSVLREAGIPGIRYLDQGSRDTGEGSHNIVIFDDSLVKITKKNGKPVTGEERQGVVDQMFALGRALRGFYSPAIYAAEGLAQKKGTGEQFWKQISKVPGVRKDELEWMGLEEFLANKKSITKAEVLDFMRAHQVELDEKVLGDTVAGSTAATVPSNFQDFENWLGDSIFDTGVVDPNGEFLRVNSSDGRSVYVVPTPDNDGTPRWTVVDELGTDINDSNSLDRAEHIAVGYFAQGGAPQETTFQGYKVPGGQNYRELLIRLPELGETKSRELTPEEHADIAALRARIEDTNAKLERTEEGAAAWDVRDELQFLSRQIREIERGAVTQHPFRSPHFGDQEIVHLRVDDRAEPNGERVLFINEVQSDLHQKGRKRGYQTPETQSKLAELAEQKNIADTELGLVNAELQEIRVISRQKFFEKIGKQPEPQIWTDVLYDFRRTFHQAADGETPSPSIVNYKKQALAAIDDLRNEGILDRQNELDKKRKEVTDRLASYRVQEIELNNLLPDAPFKGDLWLELALKRALLYASENGYDAVSWARSDQIAKAVRGDAEALSVQYDQKIGRFLSKYTKKWGGKVEADRVVSSIRNDAVQIASIVDDPDQGINLTFLENAHARANSETVKAEIRDLIDGIKSDEVDYIRGAIEDLSPETKKVVLAGLNNPILRITPEMRSSVMEGQPLAMRRMPPAREPEVLGQTDPYKMIISIAMRAVEAEARGKGVSTEQEAVRVLRHESVEFFKEMGLFTEKEWATLRSAAKRLGWVETTGVRAAYEAIYKGGMSEAELEDLLIKEAIAEQFSEYYLNRKQYTGVVAEVFRRIKDFIRRLANFMRREGFQTHEDVFEALEEGEFRERFEIAFPELAGPQGERISPMAVQGRRRQATLVSAPPTPRPGLEPSPAGSVVDIQKELRRRLGMTVARGRLNPSEIAKAARKGETLVGQYDRQSGVVRLKVLEDIGSEAHEVAHALEDRYRLDRLKNAHSAELLGIARLHNKENADDPLSEGFAEWYRLYLTNPQAAEQHAPNFQKAFEDYLTTEDVQTLTAIQDIRDQYKQWREASSAGRLVAAIKSGVKRGTWQEIRREYSQGGLTSVGGMFWRYLEQVHKSRLDATNSVRKLQMLIYYRAERNNQTLDFSAWKNPQMQAQKIRSMDGVSYGDITKGVSWENAAGRGNTSLRGALAHAFDGVAYEQWTDAQQAAFSAYLLARRGRWLWRRFEMDANQFRGRLANAPENAQPGDWYFDTMRRERRVFFGARWESELIHEPDKHSRGDHEQAITDLEAANPQFSFAAQMVYQFLRDLALKRYQAGLDSREEYEYKIGSSDYVPWFRDMTDEIFAGTALAGRKVAPKFRIKGSYRDFLNPIEGIIRQVFDTNFEIGVNKPKLLLAQMADAVKGAGRYAEIIPATRMKVEEVKIRDALESAAREEGLPPEDAKQMISSVAAMLGEDAVATLFRAQQAGEGRDAIVHYMDGGELKMLQIHDDGHGIARDILGFFENVRGTPIADSLFNMLGAAVRVPQKGITSAVPFQWKNLVRDMMQAAVLVTGYFPVISNIRTVASNMARRRLGEDTWADILARHAAIMGGIGRTDVQLIGQGRVSKLRTEGVTLRPWKREFWLQTINPWHEDFWRWAEWTEANTRQTIARIAFQRALEDVQSRYPTMPSEQQTFVALEAAAQKSRDYTDYGKMGGAQSQLVLNRLIMFLNPALQGPSKMVRAALLAETNEGIFATSQVIRKKLAPLFSDEFQNRELTKAEVDALKDALRIWVTISIIAATHLALELAFNDPEDLKDKSEFERSLYVTFTVDDEPYHIPRGFDLINVASNAMRAQYDSWAYEDPTAWARWRESLKLSLLPPMTSPLLDLYIGWKHNRNNFFESDIEPDWMQGRLPEERYTAYTSNLSKKTAENINAIAPFDVSPIMVEYTLNMIGADWSRDILRAYDMFDPEKPALKWQEYPFIRSARGLRGSRGASDYWELMGRDGEWQQIAGSYKTQAVDGKVWNEKEIRKFFDERVKDDDAKAYAILNAHYDKDQRSLHPIVRARDMVAAVSATMRAVEFNRIDVPITSKVSERREVSRSARGSAKAILAEINRREYLNALIALRRPGYENREPMPVDPYLEELEAVSPDIHKVLIDKLTKKGGEPRIYNYQEIREFWPKMRRTLLDKDKIEDIIENDAQIAFHDLTYEVGVARAKGIR